MKYFRMSYEEVVFERSYINLILLNRAIPGCKPIDEKGKSKKDGYIEAEAFDDIESKGDKSEHANDFFMNFM